MTKRGPRKGTLEVILARAFALVRQTRLDQLASLTVEVPDDAGDRWRVQFTRVRGKGRQ